MKRLSISLLGIACCAVLLSFTFGKKKKMSAPLSMVYVPAGNMWQEQGNSEEPVKTSMEAFFIFDREVTNIDYREFLADLKRNGDMEVWRDAQVDSTVWMQEGTGGEPWAKTYHWHPAYDEYPVVGVSKKAAEIYCKWLGQKWAEYDKKPKALQGVELEYRLPTKEEWMYAARGGHEHAKFPWGGYYLRNAKGCALANFKQVPDNAIKFNRETGGYEIIPGKLPTKKSSAPMSSHSMFPNDYGAYHMAGNVSEWLADGSTKGGSWNSTGYYTQIDAEDEFPNLKGQPSPFVGFRPVAVLKK